MSGTLPEIVMVCPYLTQVFGLWRVSYTYPIRVGHVYVRLIDVLSSYSSITTFAAAFSPSINHY